MPRCFIAAFCNTKCGMGYTSNKTPNGKRALNSDSTYLANNYCLAFVIVRQMGELNQMQIQQQYFLQILPKTRAESVDNTPECTYHVQAKNGFHFLCINGQFSKTQSHMTLLCLAFIVCECALLD